MAKRAIYRVSVAGQDISSVLGPILISLRVSDKEGTTSDTAEIEIDDKDAAVLLPKAGDEMSISLGWADSGVAEVFKGKVDEPRSSGARGSGRTLRISAKGLDTAGRSKEPQQLHVDNANVRTALQRAGEAAGITDIQVDPELASVTREWWGLNDESFIHFGERIARELGGVFKVQGNRAILARKGGGSVSGQAMPSVTAAWGDNLISWDITPEMGRPRHRKARARWYDRGAARWRETEVEVSDPNATATAGERYSRADEGEANGTARNHARDAEREKGGGSVEIDGNAGAKPGGTLILVGARPGIDGSYRIEGVEHNYTRSGFTTKLELKQPQGSAGTDGRRPPAGSNSGRVREGGVATTGNVG